MDEKKSGSLFDDKDIRHSVDTVEERWRNESNRRRRLAMKYGLPIVIVLLAAWLIPAKICRFFPFEKSYEEEKAEFEAMQKKAEENKTPYKSKRGNPDAKMKMYIVLYPRDELSLGCDDVIDKVLGNRPSEFYVEEWEIDKLEDEELKKLFKEDSKVGFVINGKHNFTYTNFLGVEKTYDSVNKDPHKLLDVELAFILNDEYKKIYNTDKDIYDLSKLVAAAKSDVEKKKNGPEIVVTDESELTEEDKAEGSGSIVLPGFQMEIKNK
ncbi:MAG: hypothetical protein IJS15_00560 [Victivallales bacterium]|nr:hypothetical protein [Victivallales bacterium]